MSATDPVRAIADAVLYEGYVLWPYRRSALKNAQRWTFGGVYPRAHSEARAAGDDPWTMRTQCLVEGTAPRVAIGVRFLHVVRRQLLDSDGRPVDELTVAGERHLTWDEAVERQATLPPTPLAALRVGHRLTIAFDAGRDEQPLRAEDGAPAGTIVRSWERLEGTATVLAEPLTHALHRLTVRIENVSPWAGGERTAALRRTFCSTHTVLRAEDGAFVSLTDPPASLSAAATTCENAGTWPVLVGEEGERHTLLSSPIILSDWPQIAPESPGDLFDGGEVDQLLTLSILALTDEEKAEMRASDPRTREVLERTEALTHEQLMRLHGRTVRELQVRRP
jgi:hypothetical protein